MSLSPREVFLEGAVAVSRKKEPVPLPIPRLDRIGPGGGINRSEATLPVRVRFAGGWTDTPPYCLSHDGHVVNAAVRVGSMSTNTAADPIWACAEVVATAAPPMSHQNDIGDDPNLHQHHVRTRFEFVSTTDGKWRPSVAADDGPRGLLGEDVPSSFSVAAAAVAVSLFPRETAAWFKRGESVILPKAPSSHDDDLYSQTVRVSFGVSEAIPRGSGLGTSSLLAAAVSRAVLGLVSPAGAPETTWEDIVAITMAVEQVVGTRGGWQDMTGGLVPGLKLAVSTPASPGSDHPPMYGANRICDPHGTLSSVFSRRLVLIFSGVTRNSSARNADVMGGFTRGEPDTIAMLDRLGELAREQHALFSQLAAEKDPDGPTAESILARIGATMEETHRLDCGGVPAKVADAIVDLASPVTYGCHLLGSGAGGFLMGFLCPGKGPEDALAIARRHLPDSSLLPCTLA